MAKDFNSNLDRQIGSTVYSALHSTVDTPDTPEQTGSAAAPTANAATYEAANSETDTSPTDISKAAEEEAPKDTVDVSSKKMPRLLTLGAAILLGGGAIAYLNFSQRSPRIFSPTGTQLIPQTALATVTVTTDELTWTKVRQFGTADSQEQFDSFLRQWKDQLFTLNGYSFKRDIKPWIGDRVTLAFLPAASSDSPSRSGDAAEGGLAAAAQNIVLVVPIADAGKAKSLLDAGPQSSSIDWAERNYKGIPIRKVTTRDSQTVEAAVLGTSWLLLSNTAEGVEQAIDTYKGRRSLLDNAGYRKAATRVESPQPPGRNFAQFYLNIPAATQAMAPPDGGTTRPQGSLVPLQGSEGIVATALVESDGLRFQGTSWLLPKNDLAYSELNNEASEMPRRLPSDTLLAMSGSNLQQFWQGFSEGKTIPPFFPNPQNLKAGLLTQTGLDIDEDIMPWAAGEFALGILPPPNPENFETESSEPGSAESENPASTEAEEVPIIASAPLLMMVQTNDRQTAESVWSQLDAVMVDRYRFQVEKTEFDGGSITEWISPFQGVQFSHGWLPGNVAFFAVGDGAAEAIAPRPEQPLAASQLFQTMTRDVPSPNHGHFYIDLAQVNRQAGVFPVPQIPAEGATAAIRAVGLTSTVGDRTMDYDLFVELAKAPKPGPL